MVVDGPITPPMSPCPSEDGTRSAMEQIPVTQGSQLRVDITQRRPSREMLQAEERMDIDSQPKIPPIRHLEDEQSHVQRGGPLQLTDFEVKGTLGSSDTFSCARVLTKSFFSRNGNIWQGTTRSPARLSTVVVKELFRHEGPTQD